MKDTDNTLRDMLALATQVAASPDTTEGTLAELAARYDTIAALAGAVAEAQDRLATAVAEAMEDDQMTIAGVGLVVRETRTSSSWLDDTSRERMFEDALNAIVRRVAVDPATGEMHANISSAAREVFRLAQDAFSFSADPKAAFRKVLGLSPDQYRSKHVTGYRIKVKEATL